MSTSRILGTTPAWASDSLEKFNPAQRQAVTHPADVPLQILAGPGSGKTAVLTSRIAHLILDGGLPPSSICAVTFTNKAANEMRERLAKLIGNEMTSAVKLGTFHSICAQFLRIYGTAVGLEGNFTVCSADASKKMIVTLLKTYDTKLISNNITLKAGDVISWISKAKARGHSAEEIMTVLSKNTAEANLEKMNSFSNNISRISAEIYEKYERLLRQSNSLDFDDLLIYGERLFSQHNKTVKWCKHVLVDEFQDTNTTQYRLMHSLAATHRCVTVVGDPDQSIYGWRSAEIANLSNMRRDFPTTEQILLEHNYRSTSLILKASLAIVAEDCSRIPKLLHASHPGGSVPVLRLFSTENEEANFIAMEIKRLVAHMGGMLQWGDFAVLLRFNALSRAIENALQKEGIPSKILGGHKFFDRVEIQDLLAYLQLTDNPNFEPAFTRAVNVPIRGIGDKTLVELRSRAGKTKLSPLAVAEQICDDKAPDIKPAAQRKLVPFIKVVRILRDLAEKGTSPADLIRRLLELIQYEDHLKKTQPDWESRWENVQELITFATEVETESLAAVPLSPSQTERMTPLRSFLQTSMLSSEGDSSSEADGKNKVTIATCHAAKGLEWPVIMIPSVEKGTFPFHRTEDIEEERRLLYVACTRAKGLLYLTHSKQRKFAGDQRTKQLSEFIEVVLKRDHTLFRKTIPHFTPPDRALLSKVLGRSAPDDAEVIRRVAELNERYRASSSRSPEPEPRSSPTRIQHPSTCSKSSSTIQSILPDIQAASAVLHGKSRHPPLAFKPNTVIGSASMTTSASSRPRQTSRMLPRLTMPFQPGIESDTSGSVTSKIYTSTSVPRLPAENPDPLPITSGIMPPPAALAQVAGAKRRLGMGRPVVGYSNKKFKRPIL